MKSQILIDNAHHGSQLGLPGLGLLLALKPFILTKLTHFHWVIAKWRLFVPLIVNLQFLEQLVFLVQGQLIDRTQVLLFWFEWSLCLTRSIMLTWLWFKYLDTERVLVLGVFLLVEQVLVAGQLARVVKLVELVQKVFL